VLVAGALVGRWAAVFLQAIGEPIKDDHAPRSLVATPAPAWLVGAMGLAAIAISIAALGVKLGVAGVAVTAAGVFALGIEAQRRDGGLSAPVVATAAAVGELVILLLASSG
jgi:hypothetical protein